MSRKDQSQAVIPVREFVGVVVGVTGVHRAVLAWLQVGVLPYKGLLICVPPDFNRLVAGAVDDDAGPSAVFGQA